MDLLSSMLLVFLSFHGVKSALSPSGSVFIDCGGQQTFTCTVAANGPAAWTITGLQGIAAIVTSGDAAGSVNARITSGETTADGLTSTITITGFIEADIGGTVQCVDRLGAAEGSATVMVGVPFCPTNARVTDRSSDFSSANITWDQPTNSPPVTSYDVTCNSSCTAMPCSSRSSTCRVLSVSPCEDYSVTVLPMNSCGSSTGCTGNSVVVPSQGPPQCGQVGKDYGNDSCPAYTYENPQGSPEPSTVVVSYQLVGNSSSAGSLNCDYPVEPQMCELVVPGGTYTVRLTPQNSCGSPSSDCLSFTESIMPDCNITVRTPPSTEDLSGLYTLLVLPLLLLIIIMYSICVAVVWHLCYKDYNYCQVYWCCCFCKPREGDGKKRTSSTEPMKTSPPPPPAPAPVAAAPLGEYADPKDVRKRKEENKIQYADLEFTKRSGGGQGSIHQKEEPVTYTAIQHA